MISIANSENCDLFTIGGDLFDHLRVSKKDVQRTAKILSQFDRLVLVLPGNHDYLTGQADDLWKTLQENNPDRIIVCREYRPYPLQSFDLDACIYPAPCQNKHSKTHAIGWISKESKNPGLFHIGFAHGSFEGLTPDLEGDYYPMTRDDLSQCGLDLWLMGHIHLQFPPRPESSDRIFYPSTPEPDGFDCRHEGKAWLIEIDSQKTVQARSISTGTYRFFHESKEIQSLKDLEDLESFYSDSRFQNSLVKLNLTGSLESSERFEVQKYLERIKPFFLYFQSDDSKVTTRISPERIDQEYTLGSFPHRLLKELAHSEDDRGALQLAYELMRETAKKTGSYSRETS
jgi:DNA repair exonuclease SbcCD nuclease subunit